MVGVSSASAASLLIPTPRAQWNDGLPPVPDWDLLKQVVADRNGNYDDQQKIAAYSQAKQYNNALAIAEAMDGRPPSDESSQQKAKYQEFIGLVKQTAFGKRIEAVHRDWDYFRSSTRDRKGRFPSPNEEIAYYNSMSDFAKALPEYKNYPTKVAIVGNILRQYELELDAAGYDFKKYSKVPQTPETKRLMGLLGRVVLAEGEFDDPLLEEYTPGTAASISRAMNDFGMRTSKAKKLIEAMRIGPMSIDNDAVAEAVVEMLKEMRGTSSDSSGDAKDGTARAKKRTFESIRDLVDISDQAKKELEMLIQERKEEQT